MSIRSIGGPEARGSASRSRARVMSAAFGVAVALLVGASVFSYRSAQRSVEDARWSRHTQEVIAQIREVLADMEEEEKRLQAQRDRRVETDADTLKGALLGLPATGLTLLGLAFLALVRENAGRARAEESLHHLNARLEGRVQERTAQVE